MATYGKKAAHSAYDVFSWNKYLIGNLVFSHLGFWSWNLFLIAPFPDRCLLVPSYTVQIPNVCATELWLKPCANPS